MGSDHASQTKTIVPAINELPFKRENVRMHDSLAKLFDVIEDAICASQQRFAIAREAEHLSVTYPPSLGYPIKIAIDYDELMVDEEL